MNRSEPALKTEIGNIYKNLLNEQLGEIISNISLTIFTNTLSIQSKSRLTPAELNFIKDEKNWQLLRKIKNKAFEIIVPLLKKSLEKKTNCRIKRITSSIDKQGIRYELITFDQNIEKIFVEETLSG